MFPLSTVLFPGSLLPLHVFEPRYQAMLAHCLASDRKFGVVLIDRGSEVGGGDHRVDVGTLAEVLSASPLGGGRWAVVARGTTRIRVRQWLPDDPFPVAEVAEAPPDDPADPALLAEAHVAVRRLRALLSELGSVPALAPGAFTAPGDAGSRSSDDLDVEHSTWSPCAAAPLAVLDRQRLLEVEGSDDRLRLLTELVRALADDAHRLLAEGSAGPASG